MGEKQDNLKDDGDKPDRQLFFPWVHRACLGQRPKLGMGKHNFRTRPRKTKSPKRHQRKVHEFGG